MEREALYHQTAPGRFGIPAWWFVAPFVAFVYVLVTPRWLPDLVTPPPALPANLATPLRWFVGLLLGLILMSVVQLILWLRRSKAH